MYSYSAIVSFWEVVERYWWRDIVLFGKTLGKMPAYGFYLEGKIAREAITCQCMDYSVLISLQQEMGKDRDKKISGKKILENGHVDTDV